MQLLPNGKQTFFDGAGNPLANGKVYFYLPNTSTPATTYQDASGQTPNANPVILDGNGQAVIYGIGSYRQVVQDANGVTVWDQTTTAPDAGFIDLGNTTNGKGADLVANATKKVASIAALRDLRVPTGSDAQTCIVDGGASQNDGKARIFVWNAASTAADDGALVIAPNSAPASGRWVALQLDASLINYQKTGSGTVLRTVLDRLQDQVNARDFGAKFDGATDDTTAIQAALNYLNSIGGGTLILPVGTAILSATLTVYPYTNIQGAGKVASKLSFNHTGDGIQSKFAVNGSSGAYITLRDFFITNTNNANAGAAIDQVCGSYFVIDNLFIQKFQYGVIFDQTEISSISNCNIESQSKCGVWLVNDASHSAGANSGFTNRITIEKNQFNHSGNVIQLIDDGGGCHNISNNNFNAGAQAFRFSGVSALTFVNNEVEGHTTSSLFTNITWGGSVNVGQNRGVTIRDNVMTDNGIDRHFDMQQTWGGEIKNNYFGQYASAAFVLGPGSAANVGHLKIEGNTKLITGAYKTAGPIVGGFTNTVAQSTNSQKAYTYTTGSVTTTGSNTITPASMEGITNGCTLYAVNADGTNGEQVTVTAVTGTTFTAGFSSTKAANFLIYGI